MSRRKADVAARLHIRRGLGEAEAALYIGISSTKFSELVKAGRMPRPRLIDRRRIWDVDDLDAAFRAFPCEDESLAGAPNPWH